jgi:tellurite resistance protein TerC
MEGSALGSGSWPVWVGFSVFVLAMLGLDLGVLNRKAHEVGTREALVWSVVWIVISLLFGAGVWIWDGHQQGLEFLTAYLVEKSLSIDNLFVFLITFRYFGVRPMYQHRVLFWGVIGALVMRAVFIFVGGALIHAFHWIMWVFGAFLVATGVKLLFQTHVEVHPERNPVLRVFRRLVRSTPDYREGRFTVREAGRRLATPLMAVLIVIETSDLMFAVDSIPAVFGVTQDVFIVYTSNIFAILGLRALYFLLASFMTRFKYLHVGLALVLAFVGLKMLVADPLESIHREIPILLSLGVIAGLIGVAVAFSLWETRRAAGIGGEGG